MMMPKCLQSKVLIDGWQHIKTSNLIRYVCGHVCGYGRVKKYGSQVFMRLLSNNVNPPLPGYISVDPGKSRNVPQKAALALARAAFLFFGVLGCTKASGVFCGPDIDQLLPTRGHFGPACRGMAVQFGAENALKLSQTSHGLTGDRPCKLFDGRGLHFTVNLTELSAARLVIQ